MRRKRHLLSYLAGVFDGEGCVSISKVPPRKQGWSPQYRVHIRVGMTDGAIPLLFYSTFGGSFGNWQSGKSRQRQGYWEMTGHRCLPILKELLPYVLIKRPQFEVAIHFLESTSRGGQGPRGLTDTELVLRQADFILCRELKKQKLGPTLSKEAKE